MTIGGWISFALAVVIIGIIGIAIIGIAIAVNCEFGKAGVALTVLICVILIVAILLGMLWYFNNTAAGQRALIDQKSNLNNGIERTVTVYTANGETIATYTGLIDIEINDGGYVKFDFEGKRYIYYNCFVETIAEIG